MTLGCVVSHSQRGWGSNPHGIIEICAERAASAPFTECGLFARKKGPFSSYFGTSFFYASSEYLSMFFNSSFVISLLDPGSPKSMGLGSDSDRTLVAFADYHLRILTDTCCWVTSPVEGTAKSGNTYRTTAEYTKTIMRGIAAGTPPRTKVHVSAGAGNFIL